MIVRWLGHASFLIKTQEKNIYIDPYAGDYSEKADIVLITHDHRDHCDLNKLSAIRTSKTTILTSEPCSEKIPPNNVVTMSPGESKQINGMTVHAVEAYNLKRFRSPGIPYHPKGTQVGFVLESEGKRVYHAGDTDLIPNMSELKSITLALLPIGGTYTMDLEEGVEAVLTIRPEMVMPIHRRESDIPGFKERVERRSGIKVLATNEGAEVTL